jgi:hypothetical protein
MMNWVIKKEHLVMHRKQNFLRHLKCAAAIGVAAWVILAIMAIIVKIVEGVVG